MAVISNWASELGIKRDSRRAQAPPVIATAPCSLESARTRPAPASAPTSGS
jgi:hypothetical protein